MSGPAIVLERLALVTPLGIRFWDDATHAAVSDGLVVTVYPQGRPQLRATAFANRIGTFVLSHLPGPRVTSEEFGDGDAAFWSRVQPRPYVVEVIDLRGYYQPFTVDLFLPFRGLAVPSGIAFGSPPADVVPLFPTASHPVPAGMAVVRAELRTPLPGPERRLGPASWAMVDVQVGTLPPVRGLADREGRVAVLLPYPEPSSAPARPSSPPYSNGASLADQEWPVRLSVFFEPTTPAPAIPDLRRTLDQLPAFASIDDATGSRPLGDLVLRYGQELIVRSVAITPAGSPP